MPPAIDPREYYSLITSLDIGLVAQELLGHRITEVSGSQYHCDCPNHASVSHKSLHVCTQKQAWNCFGCGVGGNVLHLVEFVKFGTVTKGVTGRMPPSHSEARDFLASKAGMPPLSMIAATPERIAEIEAKQQREDRIYGVLHRLSEIYHERLTRNHDAYDWFRRHYAINDATIDHLLIGFADHQDPNERTARILVNEGYTLEEIAASGAFRLNANEQGLNPCFPNRIIFPYWSRGRIVYWIGRRTPWTLDFNGHTTGKYRKLDTHNELDKKHIAPFIRNDVLYNEDALLSRPDHIVVTEGITDAISLAERGVPTISPVTVRIKKDDWPRILRKLQDAQVKTVYICQDNEVSGVGLNGAIQSASIIKEHGIDARLIILPLETRHKEARAAINELLQDPHGDQLDAKAIRQWKQTVTPDVAKHYDELAASAKCDLNDYFLAGNSGEDFKRLIASAISPVEYSISRIPKDTTPEDITKRVAAIIDAIVPLPPVERTRILRAILDHLGGKNAPVDMQTLRDQLKHAQKEAAQETIRQRQQQRRQAQTAGNAANGNTSSTGSTGNAKGPNGKQLPSLCDAISAINLDPPEDSASLSIPPRYTIDAHGIMQSRLRPDGMEEFHPVSSSIMFPTRRLIDCHTGQEQVEATWLENGRWLHTTAQRSIMVSRDVVKLSDHGLPVGDYNRQPVAEWLSKALECNVGVMPKVKTSGKSGWIHGHKDFLLGTSQIATETERIMFLPSGQEDVNLAKGYTPHGDFDVWTNLITDVHHLVHVRAALYAAFASVLISPLESSNGGIDFHGRTSIGKTTILRLAASVWGRPDERRPDSTLTTWNATSVGIERRCYVTCDLPTILDDTKLVRRKNEIGPMLYAITEGHGRNRGAKTGGRQVTPTWNTFLISSGESPAVSYDTSGGTRARILEITGFPLGSDSIEANSMARLITNTVKSHYGHAGRHFLEWLVTQITSNPDFIPSTRQRLVDRAASLPTTEAVSSRLADIAALISLAGELAVESGALPSPFVCPFHNADICRETPEEETIATQPTIWYQIEESADDAHVDVRAAESIISFAHANKSRFFIKEGTSATWVDPLERPSNNPDRNAMSDEYIASFSTHAHEHFGVWDTRPGGYIGFFPHILTRELVRMGYEDHVGVVNGWEMRGWLKQTIDSTRKNGRKQLQIKIQGIRHRCVAISTSVIDSFYTQKEQQKKGKRKTSTSKLSCRTCRFWARGNICTVSSEPGAGSTTPCDLHESYVAPGEPETPF